MRRSARGFTLIEVLVAVTVLTTALVQLYAVLATTYRSTGLARLQEEALVVGRSQVDRVGHDISIAPARLSGSLSDGSPWLLAISPVRGTGGELTLYQTHRVEFEARDSRGSTIVQLRTVRIARKSL